MDQLLCHLIGDYCLQNDWMARNKTRATWPCLVHVLLYLLPFLLLTRSGPALLAIVGTHFVIDRWALARRWPAFWGVGEPSWFDRWRYRRFGRPEPTTPAPDFLRVWLAIIVDNTVHLAINFLALAWL